MSKKLISLRVSVLTARQLSELAARWGTSQTETVTVCIDRAHRDEKMDNKTYRIVTHADQAIFSRVVHLDFFADLDASSETELVGKYRIAAEDCRRFEADLDNSPAVLRWEVVKGNWPAPVR